MFWLFGFNTGRGGGRARIFAPVGPWAPRQGPMLMAVIPSS
jgi:hypothetical protein